MPELALHHVSIPTRDVERAVAFYRGIFGLRPVPRPDFPVKGAWLACGDRQIHLVQHLGATFRSRGVDNDDAHFAFRTGDFEEIVARLAAYGYREDAGPDEPHAHDGQAPGPSRFRPALHSRPGPQRDRSQRRQSVARKPARFQNFITAVS